MEDKYYSHYNCDWLDEERERRGILTRWIHSACVTLIWVSIFWIWGTVGGVDHGKISLGGFFASTAVAVCVILASLWVDSQLYAE